METVFHLRAVSPDPANACGNDVMTSPMP
jgi:hypothetical protein